MSCISKELIDECKQLIVEQYEGDVQMVSGFTRCSGRVKIVITIGDITSEIELLVIEGMKFYMLLGLDGIRKFDLSVSSDLRVHQGAQTLFTQKDYKAMKCSDESFEISAVPLALSENCHFTIKSLHLSHDYTLPTGQITNNIINHNNGRNNITQHTLNEYNLHNLLNEYERVFSSHKYDIGRITIENCCIKFCDDKVVNLRPYKCSMSDQKLIDEQVDELIRYELVRRSISPYSSPVTLVDKKDDGPKSRFCIDYRKINQLTIPDNYPFPRIEDIVDRLCGSKVFSTLDVSSGFWHVEMNESDIEKTAFVTMKGHYEWLVMPFGFRNSPAVFQRVLYRVLEKYELTAFASNYLDDVMIHSKSMSEHLQHLRMVFEAFKKENVKLKLSKCRLAESKVKYLGHIISENSISPLNSNVRSVVELPAPTNVKEVQRVLGKVNFYRKFIPGATKLLYPLYALLKKSSKFEWNDECQKAFEKVKEILVSGPVLRIYDPERESFLFTDASKKGIGAILKQKYDSALLPVGYFSRKLLPYQMNYSITELECLAVVESIEYFHHYLYDRKFVVVTDHAALKWLKSVKKPNSRLFRWSLKLSQYSFEVKYNPGVNHVEADLLSRAPVLEACNNSEHLRIVNLLTLDEVRESQDDYFRNRSRGKLRRVNGVLIRNRAGFRQMYVPPNLRERLIREFHDEFGHLGVKQMLTMISRTYFWENMTSDIKSFVDACFVCQTNKVRRERKLGTLSWTGPARRPLEIVSVDTIGGLEGYNSRFRYIHLAIDHLTRFVWTLPSKTQRARDYIRLIQVVIAVDCPHMILTDRYPGIKCREFENFLDRHDVGVKYVMTQCPQSNGMAERVNQTIVNKLRCLYNERGQIIPWDRLLVDVTKIYNNTVHTVTGFSPRYLLFGAGAVNGEERTGIERARELAIQRNREAHDKNKELYDRQHKPHVFEIGDLVLVKNHYGKKLDPTMIGPYTVMERLSDNSYVINVPKRGRRSDIYHVSQLRPCETGAPVLDGRV